MFGSRLLIARRWRARGPIWLVLAAAAAALVVVSALPADAATIFADDFEDGNANGWTTAGGTWSVPAEDGSFVLRQAASPADARAIANVTGRGSAPGTLLFATVKPRSPLGTTGLAAVLFNATDANNYLYVALRAGSVEIGKRQNGVLTVLASAPYTPTVGTWQRFTLDLSFPNRVSAVVAGTLPGVRVTAAIPVATTTANKVGFATTNATASFDNIRIEDDVPPLPDTTPPTVPGTPVASAITPNGFTLNWAASTDTVGIVRYQVTTVVPPGSAAPIRVWITPTNSITITDLTPRSTNTLQVRALDAANNASPNSGTVIVTTAPPSDLVPPTAPGTPTASNITSTGLTLSWAPSTDNVGVTSYFLRNGSQVTIGPAATPTITLAGLLPGQTYTFVVFAMDAALNHSPDSAPITVTLPNVPSGCQVTYRIVSQWQTGFQAEVTIGNRGPSPVSGWTLRWTFLGGQTITNLWNAALIGPAGPGVTIGDAGWNATIAPNTSVAFGFVGNGAGTTPTAFTLNGAACTAG